MTLSFVMWLGLLIFSTDAAEAAQPRSGYTPNLGGQLVNKSSQRLDVVGDRNTRNADDTLKNAGGGSFSAAAGQQTTTGPDHTNDLDFIAGSEFTMNGDGTYTFKPSDYKSNPGTQALKIPNGIAVVAEDAGGGKVKVTFYVRDRKTGKIVGEPLTKDEVAWHHEQLQKGEPTPHTGMGVTTIDAAYNLKGKPMPAIKNAGDMVEPIPSTPELPAPILSFLSLVASSVMVRIRKWMPKGNVPAAFAQSRCTLD